MADDFKAAGTSSAFICHLSQAESPRLVIVDDRTVLIGHGLEVSRDVAKLLGADHLLWNDDNELLLVIIDNKCHSALNNGRHDGMMVWFDDVSKSLFA